MRFHTMLSSSAALAALCSLLVVSGGCGGDGTSEGDGSNPALHDGELGGGFPSSGTRNDESAPAKNESPGNGEAASGKVTICHVPPGNPANAHTLVVSVQGWENGHQRHRGDYLGACRGSDNVPDAGTSEPDAGTSEPDAGTSEPDAGTSTPDAGPVCAPVGEACGGDGAATCCSGLECREGLCARPVIIN
jgi:hypothetical protein